MKLIGLLGGMSWESTALYYRIMNEEVRGRLGGLHSARITLHSVDFFEIEQRQHSGDWDGTADILGDAAQSLRAAGADFLVIATNTMHKVVAQIEAASGLSVLHIADPTGEALVQAGVKHVALLGTRFTMEQDFFCKRLEEKFGLKVLTPDTDDRQTIHRVIYEELCHGVTKPESADCYCKIIAKLKIAGAQAVILGCTEISMIVNDNNSPLPVFDTTSLHAKAAVAKVLCF
jgi:aspartate racemase